MQPAVPYGQPENRVPRQKFAPQREPATRRAVSPETPQSPTGCVRAGSFVLPRPRRANAGGRQKSPAQAVLQAQLKPVSAPGRGPRGYKQVTRTRHTEQRREFHWVPTRDGPVGQRQASHKQQTEQERTVDGLHGIPADRTDQQSG